MSNLKPGGHRLQVRAQDEGGDVELTPVELAFAVLPAPLQTRPWFRPVVIMIFAAILLLAIAATERARKYARTNVSLKLAQDELRSAHDHLEKRVEERTAQLHHEMNARQKAEVQFAAITAERNRMGRELHDTLEQGLAGVSLQLEAAKMFSQEPETANRHLTLARDLLRQSQTEVRRSVRDLRAQLLEKHDLPTAFRSLARQLAEGTALTIHVQTSGAVCRLPALVENNLFRIGQEAIANALKHSGANRMAIELCYMPNQLTLCIRDNGRGFNESSITSGEGHFGLLGMRERAKRLGGDLSVESLSAGTKVEVSLSLPAKLAEVDVI